MLVTSRGDDPCNFYDSNKLKMSGFGEEMQNQHGMKRVDEGHGQLERKSEVCDFSSKSTIPKPPYYAISLD
jgi:hypothetical protein